MNNINEIIAECKLCQLKGTEYALPRIHRGEGKKIMFIGEAPGEEEGKQHLAFVGRSGKLLDKWIEYLGIDNYVISNVVRHRPPNNRVPTYDELEACYPYLEAEIERENPAYIIALGKTTGFVLGMVDENKPMEYAFRRIFLLGSRLASILYHPSYILRSHKDMTPYLDDLKRRLK